MRKAKRQYTMMDALMASPDKPMPVEKQIYQLDKMRCGLEAMQRGGNPEPDDWRCVSDAINLMETMQEMRLVDDSEGLIKDAVFAMGEAGARAMNGKTLRLSDAGISACRYLLDDYASAMSQLSERTIIHAYMRTEKRISEILQGKRRKHDVHVIAI